MAQEANLNLELLKWVQDVLKAHGNLNINTLEWLFKNDLELPSELQPLLNNPNLRSILEDAVRKLKGKTTLSADIEPIVLRLEAKCGPTYIGFEWAIRRTLEYLQDRGSARIPELATALKDDYMWIVKYLYWIYSEASIPRLVRCVVEELASEGLVRLEGNNVVLA
jgi:hypothetical protein